MLDTEGLFHHVLSRGFDELFLYDIAFIHLLAFANPQGQLLRGELFYDFLHSYSHRVNFLVVELVVFLL